MKFRLSTMLLLIAIAGVSLAWFVEKTSRESIVGTWYYPTSDINLTGYNSTLEIGTDGTFTKIQQWRTTWKAFSGSYRMLDDGRILFQIEAEISPNWSFDEDATKLEQIQEKKPLNASFECRYAVDSAGYLILDVRNSSRQMFEDDKCDVRWETHSRIANTYIREIEIAR